MAEFTPDLEFIAHNYVKAEQARNRYKGPDFHQSREEIRAEFDRGIAAERAKWAAEIMSIINSRAGDPGESAKIAIKHIVALLERSWP